MSTELLRPFERVLNRNIASSGRARALLAELAGRSMEVRFAATPVITRIVDDRVLIDLRTVSEAEEDELIEGLGAI